LIAYKTFVDLEPDGEAPPGYKKIRCHIIYDVKHDGRHKAHIVAGGHLTDPNTESGYSGVVSLRGIRLIAFLAELNGLELWRADVGNAYLDAKTKEKVYIECILLLDRSLARWKDIHCWMIKRYTA
jgi:hypothetical protein